MKVKSRRTVSPRARARNERRVSASRLPSFADAAKRVAGMMEGAPNLSSREGFGPLPGDWPGQTPGWQQSNNGAPYPAR